MQHRTLVLWLAVFIASEVSAARYSEAQWQARFPHRVFPDYPAAYRRQHLEGSGLYRMHVDEHGTVTTITILKSTGHRELDALAMKALTQWHGLPGPKWELDMPITFTLHRPKNPADTKAFRGS